MPEAIVNTSPLVYLYRAGVLEWLRLLFDKVWVPAAVVQELEEGIKGIRSRVLASIPGYRLWSRQFSALNGWRLI